MNLDRGQGYLNLQPSAFVWNDYNDNLAIALADHSNIDSLSCSDFRLLHNLEG